MADKLTPGTPAPSKGIYDELDEFENETGRSVEIEEEGDRLPPTTEKGHSEKFSEKQYSFYRYP